MTTGRINQIYIHTFLFPYTFLYTPFLPHNLCIITLPTLTFYYPYSNPPFTPTCLKKYTLGYPFRHQDLLFTFLANLHFLYMHFSIFRFTHLSHILIYQTHHFFFQVSFPLFIYLYHIFLISNGST